MVLVTLLVSANRGFSHQYVVPEKLNDGWETASLKEANLKPDLIDGLFQQIEAGAYQNVHSVLIVKKGKLAVEEYYPGHDSSGQSRIFTRETLNEMKSATKSVNSILMGIALDRAAGVNVNEKISAFFPQYSIVFTNTAKNAIRLKHLLCMTAGFSWDEWTYPYTDPRNDAAMMASTADFFGYVLERPMAAPPGAKFTYNSGISLILGELVRKISGLPADQFAERQLFAPLGITNYYWQTAPNGVVNTLGGLRLRPRDMAKIGQLMLDAGRWKGKQIVSEYWVRDSTMPQTATGELPAWFMADGYGYQWWLDSFHVQGQVVKSFSARGQGGQLIIAFPTLQLVAVITGWSDDSTIKQPLDMVRRYLVPAALP